MIYSVELNMLRKYNLFLNDILENIYDIKDFIKDYTYEEFVEDKKTINAVTRSFEIIGEAVSNIPNEIKIRYNYIPWKDIKNFRNIIIHQYWSIDYEAEWSIIKTKLDILEKQIKDVIDKEKKHFQNK
jgi:uncharacterized protein with HEPN domain